MIIFDDRIPILKTDANQEEYEKNIKKFPEYDKSYVFNASYLERRGPIQKAYDLCREYLDDDFCNEIRLEGNFIGRLWELQLCLMLLNNGYKLKKFSSKFKKKNPLPDFCILDSDNGRIWIEAVCPNLGINNFIPPKTDMEPGVIYTRDGKIFDDLEVTAPRIISSLIEKHKKRNNYSKSTEFNVKDRFIIAINTHHINHIEPRDMTKELVLYGMGLQYIKQNGESGRHFHWEIEKKGSEGAKLPVALFHRDDFKDLSAVIFSNDWFKFGPDFESDISESMNTYFNLKPLSPIDRDLIKFGKKHYMECDEHRCELFTED